MKVGFLSNQLDNRGTGNAMFDYAKYNRDLLGNESRIYTFGSGVHSPDALARYWKEFGAVWFTEPKYIQDIQGLDALYHIKYGNDDGIRTDPSVRYCVHSVFTNTPHGDRYATVSEWLSSGTDTDYVPHIVDLPITLDTYREELGIPQQGARVFGRYGGWDTFDISWVWDVMEKILSEHSNVYFLFANTQPFLKHKRVIYMDELVTPLSKSIFINTCNFMLHARHRGETFGISVGEFASKGRRIITYGASGERAHIVELEKHYGGYYYNDQFDLYRIMNDLIDHPNVYQYNYTDFKPRQVMEKFNEVFLCS